MPDFLRFIPEALRPKSKEVGKIVSNVETKKPSKEQMYDSLVGMWPEMREAIESRMESLGFSELQIAKAGDLIDKASDYIFRRSASKYSEKFDETPEKRIRWIKAEWQDAFRQFDKLLRDNGIDTDTEEEKRVTILRYLETRPLERDKNASVSSDISADDLLALRNIIPPEIYAELLAKKQTEAAQVENIEQSQEKFVPGIFDGLEDLVDRAA